jgi:hypothetical protein
MKSLGLYGKMEGIAKTTHQFPLALSKNKVNQQETRNR